MQEHHHPKINNANKKTIKNGDRSKSNNFLFIIFMLFLYDLFEQIYARRKSIRHMQYLPRLVETRRATSVQDSRLLP